MNSNYDNLLNSAAAKLGSSPEKLRKALENRDLKALSAALSKSDKEKLRRVLSDKELMEKLKNASSPEDVMRIVGKK